MTNEQARILIVCTGNICRSPFIERLLQLRLDERLNGGPDGQVEDHGGARPRKRLPAAPGILVSSAGTGAVTGWPMDERAAAQLVAHGGDPSGFRARDLTPDLIAESDLVLTATREHRGKVAVMYPKALRRVFTFRDFAHHVEDLEPNSLVPPSDPGQLVRQITEQAARRRGHKHPLDVSEADIVDPYRREDDVFVTMAQQVIGSMPAVVRALAG